MPAKPDPKRSMLVGSEIEAVILAWIVVIQLLGGNGTAGERFDKTSHLESSAPAA